VVSFVKILFLFLRNTTNYVFSNPIRPIYILFIILTCCAIFFAFTHKIVYPIRGLEFKIVFVFAYDGLNKNF